MDCREGACSTCKCRVESGSYYLGDYIEDAFSKDEADTGYALACQMRPKSRLRRAHPDRLRGLQDQAGRLRHDASRSVQAALGQHLLAGAGGRGTEEAVFLPGQYANLQVPGEEKHHRAYSFSSVSADRDCVSFLIRNVPGGLMSGFLSERAKPGGEIKHGGPFGSFYLRPSSGRS